MSEGKYGEPWEYYQGVDGTTCKKFHGILCNGEYVGEFKNKEDAELAIACVNAFAGKEPSECVVVEKHHYAAIQESSNKAEDLNFENERLEKENADLKAKLEKAREGLEKLEWSLPLSGGLAYGCPICKEECGFPHANYCWLGKIMEAINE